MTPPGPQPTVTFNDVHEYLTELGRDRDRVDRRILRVTVGRRYGAAFVTVSVVATALVEGVVVRLDRVVGEAFVGDEQGAGLAARTQTLLDELTEGGQALGLEVRAGVYG